MTNKTLIAYFTKGGASEEYAKVITEVIKANGISVEILNLAHENPDVKTFDSVVLGTGVRIGMVYRRWRKVLKQKALHDKRLFLFLSSGTAIEDPEKAVEKFLKPVVDKYGLKPVSLISFPGKYPTKQAMVDNEKDTIKPEAAKAWAQKIADQIKEKMI